MSNDQTAPRRFPPARDTFAGTIALRVAAAIDTRDALVEGFGDVDVPDVFPGETQPTPAEVADLVDAVIADHNEHVRRATPEAIQLLDAIDGLPTRGLAVSFGEGGDDAAALDAVVRSAGVAIGHGATVEGYCYSTSSDVAELVAEGRLPMTYGVFAETGISVAEVAERVREVLGAQGLPVAEDDEERQRVVIAPVRWAVPFHGHALHEVAPPEDVEQRGRLSR